MPSREAVYVVLRLSTSISPDCSAVKRCSAESGVYSTASASPSTAAAMTLQKSMSKPSGSPPSPVNPKPGHGVVHSAAQRAAILHFLEEVAAAITLAARLRLAGVARSVTVAAVVVVIS